MSAADNHLSFDVRVWAIRRQPGARRTTSIVRWVVRGQERQRTFATIKMAESFRATLLVAVREGQPFDVETGLPAERRAHGADRTWFEHALDYVRVKWPAASPRHRKGIAEALTAVTPVLVREGAQPPDGVDLRRALSDWAFNAPAQAQPVPEEHSGAIAWITKQSLPLGALEEPSVVRLALGALSVKLDGRPAANATITRKRATFHNALEYGVELGAFDANPLRRVRVRLPKTDDAIDRGVVVNPTQARALLAAVRERNPALEGFFACLYFAGLRPAEARNLRRGDCTLPESGWGEVVLTGSHQYSGAAWTDSGRADEERQLKHRSNRDLRRIPLHPELVEILHRHLRDFGTGADDRLFVTRTGKAGKPLPPPYLHPVSLTIIYTAWQRARDAALTPEQAQSTLGRRPYDLRHAGLSTWLNAGVAPAQVAKWAGHSVEVLLKVYAKCIDGQEEAARRRIEDALE